MSDSGYNAVWFTNCELSHNSIENLGVIIRVVSFASACRSTVYVINCTFSNNHNFIAIEVSPGYDSSYNWEQLVSLHIENTSFHSLHCCMSVLSLTQARTFLKGPVTFTHITRNRTASNNDNYWLTCRSILESSKSKISIHGYIEISNTEISGTALNLKDT